MRRLAVLPVLALVLALVPASPPAAAHPLPHGDTPRITNPAPAPGDVVGPGTVEISALAAADRPITGHRMLVNGREVDASRTDGSHATVAATVTLEPGPQIIEVVARTDAGERSRRWGFTVSPLRADRLAGAERIQTAVAISRDLYPADATAQAAVVGRADDFPDALAGATFAREVNGPLLLTQGSRLTDATAEELRRVLADQATIYLLGGEGALSGQVARDAEALGFPVERVHGANRYETGVEIAALVAETTTAVVASGETFADALAASAPAARDGWPVLLTRSTSLPGEVAAYLSEHGFEQVYIVGGAGAVGDAVEQGLQEVVGSEGVERIAGRTRYETAARIGQAFFDSAEQVAVANGARFPDALAGGVHAAARDAPLLLVSSSRVFDPQLDQLGQLQPARARVYGGSAVVGAVVVGDLRRGVVDAGGPRILRVEPGDGEVSSLDTVTIEVDRDINPDASSIYMTLNGNEVAGRRTSDSTREVTFSVDTLPNGLRSQQTYEVRLVARVTDGDTTRHVERRFTYRQPFRSLSRGDSGREVEDLQRQLRNAGYWLGAVDGQYGSLTHQAVLAFQKVHGMERTGTADQALRERLAANPSRPRARTGAGDGLYYEVDLERQILMRVVNGRVDWIFNTSTGHGRVYTFQGATYRATTSTGRHRITRQIDGPREAERGLLWRPKYYDTTRGIAIHGSHSVPEYPASAGCIRVTNAAMDFLWSQDPNIGAGVWVYPHDYYG